MLKATGLAAGRVEVQFQSLFNGSVGASNVFVHRTDDSVFRINAVDTTDLLGFVTVQTQHGFTTGTAGLLINVPALGYVDTLWFSVDPGNAVRVRVAPADTAVYPAPRRSAPDCIGSGATARPSSTSETTRRTSASTTSRRPHTTGRAWHIPVRAARAGSKPVSVCSISPRIGTGCMARTITWSAVPWPRGRPLKISSHSIVALR